MWFFSGKFVLLSRFVQLAFSKPDARKILELKALCHVVRADCSLMNPHAPSQQMETGQGGWLISLCFYIQVYLLRLFMWHVPRFKHCMCNISLACRYSYPLTVPTAKLWASWLDGWQNLCATRVQSPHTPVHYYVIDVGHAHTSCTHVDWIFKIMSSLRSTCDSLIHCIMPLRLLYQSAHLISIFHLWWW